MKALLHSHHPFRIFFITGMITLLSLGAIGYYLGPSALFLAFVLMLIEVTFSFDNAIINAKVLSMMSRFWQTLFMTVGILIAVFGMRLIFPILIVMITANLSAPEVIELATQKPELYSQKLNDSHVAIASFGGMFLLMLCFHFFFDSNRKVRWIDIIERPLQRLGKWWTYMLTCLVILAVISLLPFNHHATETFIAGIFGILTYVVVHGLAELLTRKQEEQNKHVGKMVVRTGMAGFMSFLYLEVLDASFSLDGVIGAFAITQDVILIAVGLGVGALWVRSLTLFMVRRRTLSMYRYLEHGAHYTIGVLGLVLVASLFIDIPEAVAGLAGLVIVGTAISSSVVANRIDAARQGEKTYPKA